MVAVATSYDHIEGIAGLLEAFIMHTSVITKTIPKCTRLITVATTRYFRKGDPVILRPQATANDDDDFMENNVIDCFPSPTEIQLKNETLYPYEGNQATIERTLVKQICRGNPPTLKSYPAITVDLQRFDEQKGLTTATVSDTYQFEIMAFVERQDYQASLRALHTITTAIRQILTVTLFPLIPPFLRATLVEDTTAYDTLIKVDGDCLAGYVTFDDGSFVNQNFIKSNLGNGVFELNAVVGKAYKKDVTTITHPLIHLFNQQIHSIIFDRGQDDKKLLKLAKIQYSYQQELDRVRYGLR